MAEQEVRIERLEKETKILKKRVDYFYEVIRPENEQLKEQIADIKANCDLAIEGRDVKIKELEKENKKLEEDFRVCEKNADTYYDQLTKATEIIKGLYFIIQSRIDYENNTGIADEMWRAEQFLKEIEK